MRTFIDSIIDMKIDECDEGINQIRSQIEEIERREPWVVKGTTTYRDMQNEFLQLIIKQHRLALVKEKLLKVYVRRNMVDLFEEYDSINDFMQNGVAEVLSIKRKVE